MLHKIGFVMDRRPTHNPFLNVRLYRPAGALLRVSQCLSPTIPNVHDTLGTRPLCRRRSIMWAHRVLYTRVLQQQCHLNPCYQYVPLYKLLDQVMYMALYAIQDLWTTRCSQTMVVVGLWGPLQRMHHRVVCCNCCILLMMLTPCSLKPPTKRIQLIIAILFRWVRHLRRFHKVDYCSCCIHWTTMIPLCSRFKFRIRTLRIHCL